MFRKCLVCVIGLVIAWGLCAGSNAQPPPPPTPTSAWCKIQSLHWTGQKYACTFTEASPFVDGKGGTVGTATADATIDGKKVNVKGSFLTSMATMEVKLYKVTFGPETETLVDSHSPTTKVPGSPGPPPIPPGWEWDIDAGKISKGTVYRLKTFSTIGTSTTEFRYQFNASNE